MNKQSSGLKRMPKIALFLWLMGCFGVVGVSGQNVIEVSSERGTLYFVSTLPETARMKLVVSGPDGFRHEESLEADGLFWSPPADVVDGMYRYDVYAVAPREGEPPAHPAGLGDERGDSASSYSTGSFRISNGMIEPSQAHQAGDEDFSSVLIGTTMRLFASLASAGVSQAHAQNLTASSTVPTVRLEDTQITPPGVWEIFAAEQFCAGNDSSRLIIEDQGNGNDVITVCGQGASATAVPNVNTMVVDSLGDIAFSSSQVFIERATGQVGIGTTTPDQELTIVESSFPFIRLEETGGTSNTGIAFENPTTGGNAKILALDPDGNLRFATNFGFATPVLTWEDGSNFIGIGTNDPTRRLDVVVDGGGGDGVPLRLANTNGKLRFLMEASGQQWTFDNTPNADGGFFSISKVGTGVNEMRVDADGDLFMNNRSFAVQHINTSSRAAKTDFAPVSPLSILEKVVALPISQWRYKSEAVGEVHVGPVAEDFRDLFGLGDGKTISTVDASGVTLAALKGLHQIVQEKDAEIEAMKAANDRLAERLARLEAMLLAQ